MTANKIVSISQLQKILAQHRSQKKIIVYCHGVFDLLHPGHLKHLEAAKCYGDVLVVTITADKFVNKGIDRPVFVQQIRAEAIAAIQVVDYVAINDEATAVSAIKIITPNYFVKGQEFKSGPDITGALLDEKKAVEDLGGQLVFTEGIQFSSSSLINRFFSKKGETIERYLQQIRKQTSYSRIKNYFEKFKKWNILVIGDIILDEYQFVKPLGKASKSSTITAQLLEKELYAGGILAVANHLADFVNRVTLVSSYGINQGIHYLPFIQENCQPNIDFIGLETPDRPTTLKRRFLDSTFHQKIFENIEIHDCPLSDKKKKELSGILSKISADFDLILVADFGHGLLDREIIEHICARKEFLAVNAQTNSANYGYNLLTRYPRCDYFAIDQEEARLAVYDRMEDIRVVHSILSDKTQAKIGAITLGANGCLIGDRHHRFIKAPILSHEIIDTIGAGDAFLSITSLLAKIEASTEEIAFVGNAVGAMAVKILGNKYSIQRIPLLKYIKSLLA